MKVFNLAAGVAGFAVSCCALAQGVATERWVDVRKTLTGAPAGFPTSYSFSVNCPGSSVIPTTITLTANAAGVTLPSRSVGATCTLTEIRPVPPTGYVWTSADTVTFVVQPPPGNAPPQSPQQVIFANTLAMAPTEITPASVPTLGHFALTTLGLLITFTVVVRGGRAVATRRDNTPNPLRN